METRGIYGVFPCSRIGPDITIVHSRTLSLYALPCCRREILGNLISSVIDVTDKRYGKTLTIGPRLPPPDVQIRVRETPPIRRLDFQHLLLHKIRGEELHSSGYNNSL